MEEKTIKKRRYRSKDTEPVAPVEYVKEKVEEPVEESHTDEAPSTSYHDAVVTANALNLRVGPSKNEKVLMVLKKGQHVIVDEGFVSNLWSFVRVAVDFGEVSGYVMTQFIK